LEEEDDLMRGQTGDLGSINGGSTDGESLSGLDASVGGRLKCGLYAFFIIITFLPGTLFTAIQILSGENGPQGIREKLLVHLIFDFMLAVSLIGLFFLIWAVFAPRWIHGLFTHTASKVLILFAIIIILATLASVGLLFI
jgi:hypothetical protein